MKKLTEEVISARMGYLEEILRTDTEFQQQTKALHGVSYAFKNGCGMTNEGWKLYNVLEETFIVNNILYSQAAYKLGYSDGFSVGMEQKPECRKLSLEDMTNLISIYDCIQKLKEFLLGNREECWEKGGGFTVFESIYSIIEHATTAEIRLLGEDEVFERVTSILNSNETSEKRAKQLLGIV